MSLLQLIYLYYIFRAFSKLFREYIVLSLSKNITVESMCKVSCYIYHMIA